jgi:hypothetical protein
MNYTNFINEGYSSLVTKLTLSEYLAISISSHKNICYADYSKNELFLT